ncbi:hypothetical protein LOTGIDRAFT_166083 [Lottia gigantea]|uniref:Uncharacterized protein n=1 Tax=Lottia gigantea TaxID=225164 RepID=V4A479_LOTGI|nr:hypothetical protein LOTGIDRAFT_166083 [Lottia gigantea]ESO88056.1 hypothetical protein LOTGIDRAFT_166083 [Lottia gigantea]
MEGDDDLGVRTFRCFSDSVLTKPTFKIQGEIRPEIPPDASLETVGLTTLVDYVPHSDKLPMGSEIHQQILQEISKTYSQQPEHMMEESPKNKDIQPSVNPRRRTVSYSETTKVMVPKTYRPHSVVKKLFTSNQAVPVKSPRREYCKKSKNCDKFS